MHDILKFLSALSANNNREWFDVHRAEYQLVKVRFEEYVSTLIAEIAAIDPSIGIPVAKDCIFRIFRDVRFSANKQPYKTNFGAFIANGGRKSPRAGYYIHVEPGHSMIAGGIYMPQPDLLKKLRQEIYFNVPEFKAILNDKDFKSTFGELATWDMLKRPPKDFPADFPDIELLKYKSYSVAKGLDDNLILSDKFNATVLHACESMRSFNHFLNRSFEG
ncbi:MAG: DUF2461 domain-containing protein [Lentimicrobiaceae bacterium]|nr:DUF2461 domain-containing protein [Lentimicrobiaceae bacterium]